MKSLYGRMPRCDVTELFEAAIVRHQTLHLRRDDGHGQLEELRFHPTDLQARDGHEYLLGHDDGGAAMRLPLEQIVSVREFSDQIGRPG